MQIKIYFCKNIFARHKTVVFINELNNIGAVHNDKPKEINYHIFSSFYLLD